MNRFIIGRFPDTYTEIILVSQLTYCVITQQGIFRLNRCARIRFILIVTRGASVGSMRRDWGTFEFSAAQQAVFLCGAEKS